METYYTRTLEKAFFAKNNIDQSTGKSEENPKIDRSRRSSPSRKRRIGWPTLPLEEKRWLANKQ